MIYLNSIIKVVEDIVRTSICPVLAVLHFKLLELKRPFYDTWKLKFVINESISILLPSLSYSYWFSLWCSYKYVDIHISFGHSLWCQWTYKWYIPNQNTHEIQEFVNSWTKGALCLKKVLDNMAGWINSLSWFNTMIQPWSLLWAGVWIR